VDRYALSERDLRTLVGIAAKADPNDAGEPLPQFVLEGIRELIPCDRVVFCAMDPETWAEQNAFGVPLYQEFPHDKNLSDGDLAALGAAFRTHYWHCIDCSYPDVSGDLESVIRLSDFYSDRSLRDIGMWADYLGPLGFAREIKACLPSRPSHTIRVIFWRGPGTDFTERDRAVLTLLRPHLTAHLRRWRTRKIAALLTPRQVELLGLVRDGHTNAQISRRLVVSEATVRTHLDNIYRRLGVTNRVAAIRLMWPGESGDPIEPRQGDPD
jgi:DNA-binding CsgD family transcriptional regulator